VLPERQRRVRRGSVELVLFRAAAVVLALRLRSRVCQLAQGLVCRQEDLVLQEQTEGVHRDPLRLPRRPGVVEALGRRQDSLLLRQGGGSLRRRRRHPAFDDDVDFFETLRLPGRIPQLASWLVRPQKGLVLYPRDEGVPATPHAAADDSGTVRLRGRLLELAGRLVRPEKVLVLRQRRQGVHNDNADHNDGAHTSANDNNLAAIRL